MVNVAMMLVQQHTYLNIVHIISICHVSRQWLSVMTQCAAELKENKVKCYSHRSKRELCRQMFNAVKRGEKKKRSLFSRYVNCTI